MPLAMLGASGRASAAALVGAAVYQASPVSRRCLTRCRTPLARIVVGWRVGRVARVRATRPVPTDEPVACGIPGYDRAGLELYADELVVDDEPFAWELTGTCAFASDFDYASG